jgi:hypothetical protein
MIKKNILSLIFILGVGMFLFPNGQPQKERYVGKTIDQIILRLGEPSGETFRVIDENYRGMESEPDYYKFFSLDELRETVTVRIVAWNRGRRYIVVWAKEDSDKWVIFSSYTRIRGYHSF